MANRINEDIRFYLPADPYYYQVDNLPLEDLVLNDRRLQEQIDEMNAGDQSTTINRDGFNELRPYIDTALPGQVVVKPGSFLGRAQRTSDNGLPGMTGDRNNNGIWEMNTPPTKDYDSYSVSNPPNDYGPENFVGRTALYQFLGGNIMLDSFDFNDFGQMNDGTNRTAPLARIDLVGITTVNGAFDDPYMDGNGTTAIMTGTGYPQLAVIKGAGMVDGNATKREIVVGERYITVGTAQEHLNDYGRDLEGNIVPNPTFGTIPSPDDAINICMTRGDMDEAMHDFADRNKNETFFLPLAYVYVPQSHIEGNPIPPSYVRDIRPFFRTAELTLAERQAVANSIEPSVHNPLVTEKTQTNTFTAEVNRRQGALPLQEQLDDVQGQVNSVTVERQVWLSSQKVVKSGRTGHVATIDLTNAIRVEDREKRIVSVQLRIRPYGGTGDIGTGWIGVRRNGDNYWMMNWGNDISHSSMVIAQVVTFTTPVNEGTLSITSTQTGSNQSVYWYLDGYVVEENI